MEGWDIPLLAIWSVALGSLLLQVYMFATWPAAGGKKRSSDPDGAALMDLASLPSTHTSGPNASVSLPWEPPPDSVLDGIFPVAPPVAGANARGRSPRTKRAVPVTLQQRIVRAGIYHKGGMRAFHVTRCAITAAAFGLASFASLQTSLPLTYALCAGLVAALGAYLAPSFWLDQRLRDRQVSMRRALPDALDLITVCIQGGLSLPAALDRVSRELGPAHPMLATELAIVGREIQMGRTVGSAMLQYAQRFNLEELRSLAAVVGQTERYGGSIASALKTYAEGLRTKRRQRAEELAQQAAVKLLFPTLFCIFPGIFVVVLGPTALRLYEVMLGVSWGG